MALVLATASLVALASPADARQASAAKTQVSFLPGPPVFHGVVSSPRASCERDRRVKLIRVKRGGSRVVLGRDQTNGGGEWAIPIGVPKPGRYVAKAKREGGCDPARSPALRVVG